MRSLLFNLERTVGTSCNTFVRQLVCQQEKSESTVHTTLNHHGTTAGWTAVGEKITVSEHDDPSNLNINQFKSRKGLVGLVGLDSGGSSSQTFFVHTWSG